MTELFGRTGNFVILVRVVSCVRGEQRWGPISTGNEEEENIIDEWTRFQLAIFLPNSIRTRGGVIATSEGMTSALLHIRAWLLSVCADIWEMYANNNNREHITDSMRARGYSHLIWPVLLHRDLFETEFKEQWNKFVSILLSDIAFNDVAYNTTTTHSPDEVIFGGQVRCALDAAVAVIYTLAVCCKPNWAVEAGLRISFHDILDCFIFFKQECLRQ